MKYYLLLFLLFITNKSLSQEAFSDFCSFNSKLNVNDVEVLNFESCNVFGFEVQDVLFYKDIRTNVTYSEIDTMLEVFINTVNEPKTSFSDKLASFNKYLGTLNYFTLPLFGTVFEDDVKVHQVDKLEYTSNCKSFLINYQSVDIYMYIFKYNGKFDDGVLAYDVLVMPFKEGEVVYHNKNDRFISAYCDY
jgi:hypothetical protein